MPQESPYRPDFHDLRRKSGLNQRKLAAAVQKTTGVRITNNVLSSWEQGRVRRPSYDYIKAVASILGLSIDELYAAVEQSWRQAQPESEDPVSGLERNKDPAQLTLAFV